MVKPEDSAALQAFLKSPEAWGVELPAAKHPDLFADDETVVCAPAVAASTAKCSGDFPFYVPEHPGIREIFNILSNYHADDFDHVAHWKTNKDDYNSPEWINQATAQDCFNFAFSCIRAERFSGGLLQSLANAGFLTALAHRVLNSCPRIKRIAYVRCS
jgi:hypothetical protein